MYSISAGLDYPGVGPEHAFFKDSGRVEYVAATDDEAVEALLLLSKTEGILPAIEAHTRLQKRSNVLHNWIKIRSLSSTFPDVGIKMWLPSPII